MMAAGFENSELPINDANPPGAHRHSPAISVKVTDYSHGNFNPSPIKLSKDSTDFLEEFLSPRKLQALTGVDNLDTVNYLEMRVNTDQMSLGNFGMYLPNLTQIKLSGSYIPTIRDLGTSLWNLQVLWMPQCCLHCLDGLVTMLNMKELYLAYNEIEDISACGMLENLEILDLEGNHIKDTSNLHYLSMCTNLSRLTLEGNPICNPSNFQLPMTYRKFVFESISHLEYLDDISTDPGYGIAAGDSPPTPVEPNHATNATLELEDHWNFINSMLVESGLLAESKDSLVMPPLTPEDSGRPSSSVGSSRPTTSVMRPMSAQRRALATALGRPATSGAGYIRPTSSSDSVEEKADDSGLTAGHVVCGNVTRSLRRGHASDLHQHPMTVQTARAAPIESVSPGSNTEESCERVLEELSCWRRDYEKSKARIASSKQPQVLTIDHTEDDIEHVVMTDNIAASRPPTIAADTNGHEPVPRINYQNCAPSSLNPLRTRAPPPIANQKTVSNKAAPSPVAPTPQMSRMRRQLMQSGVGRGVNAIAPSKPLLKR